MKGKLYVFSYTLKDNFFLNRIKEKKINRIKELEVLKNQETDVSES